VAALKELETIVGAAAQAESRWFFDMGQDNVATNPSCSSECPSSQAWRLRSLRLVQSVRTVVLHAPAPEHLERDASAASALADWVTDNSDWSRALIDRASVGNPQQPQRCHVTCKRRRGAGLGTPFSDDLSLPFRQALALSLEKRFGWFPERVRSAADIEVHVVLGANGSLLVEVPILAQRSPMLLGGGLPAPGMKQIECWALARTLNIQPNEVVLDPMCGCGTLLVEASLWWPSAKYVGCDLDLQQLERCNANSKALGVEVKWHQANISEHNGLPLEPASVDKLLTAPPWGRQFRTTCGVAELYRCMLLEFRRVLRPSGTVAILASVQSLEPLLVAIERDGGWRCLAQRRFALTDETTGVIIVAQKGVGDGKPCPEPAPLWWEAADDPGGLRGTRARWMSLRSEALPTLEPTGLHAAVAQAHEEMDTAFLSAKDKV